MSLVCEVSPSELLHMREDGMSNQEIAQHLNLTLPIVKQAIRIISEKSGLSRADFAAIL